MNRKSIYNTFLKPTARFFLLAGVMTVMTACSGVVPVPGGTDSVNAELYTREDLNERIVRIDKGMSEAEVMDILQLTQNDLYRLNKNEVIIALYGTDNIVVNDLDTINALYGYRMDYKKVKKNHGFSSPISMKTKQQGYHYVMTFVFKDGVLYEEPLVSGGDINGSKSGTIFDALNPGRMVSSAIPGI